MAKKGIPLSNKRNDWLKKFKPTVVSRGKPLEYPASASIRYQKEVNKLINRMNKDVRNELKKLFSSGASKEYFVKDHADSYATDSSIASQSRIVTNQLIKKWDKIFKEESKNITKSMLYDVEKSSDKALQTSLKELSGGLSINMNIVNDDVKEIVKASFNANVKLIKSIEERYFDQIVGAVDRSIMTGGGLKDLIPAINDALKDQKRIAKNRAKNIALDQTRKAYNSINMARMESVGIDKFEWIHSGGGKEPRPHHLKKWPEGLNGGIFSFNDLPIIDEKTGQRGKPGDAVNCKCRMRPVIDYENGQKL